MIKKIQNYIAVNQKIQSYSKDDPDLLWATEYWKSLNLIKRFQLAQKCVQTSDELMFDIFYKPQYESVLYAANHLGITKLLKPITKWR